MLAAEAQLARGLNVPGERWGWEFVDGGPPAPSPLVDQEPVFTPPQLPDLPALTERRRHAVRSLWVRMLLPVLFVGFGVLLARDGGLVFVPAGLGLALLAGLPVLVGQVRLTRARRQSTAVSAKARARHEVAMSTWQAQIAAHDQAEQRRREASSAFHPITAPATTARIDVFGGDGDGWASLLATAGTSQLAAGAGILLVDLSERTVGGGLARFAGQVGRPVESWDLPGQLDEVELLVGLGPREAGELVADAFEPTGAREPDPHRRALHADLISSVSEVLGERLTFRRLAEGLRVLEGLDDSTRTVAISTPEAMELVGRMNAFGRGERIPDELRYLRSSLQALCPPPAGVPAGGGGIQAGGAGFPPGFPGSPATGAGRWGAELAGTAMMPGAQPEPQPPDLLSTGGRRLGAWWPVHGLRVIATSSRMAATHHKELADRLVVQALLHQLRRRVLGPATSRDLVVVAGADQLGRPVLTSLARQAEIAGTRLVLLFERLADDAERVLGSQGASTIIMRLGNGKDATTAAEFIGRGHRFVLSQVTAQIGRSFTVGDSDSVGTQDGTSDTAGTSGGSARTYDGTRLLPWLQNTSTNTGWQESVTTSRSQTWQRTVNSSLSDSTTDGETSARVYEFLVEPTTVQTLPATAFLLVNAVNGPQRVVLGDCNPGTVLLPRVSPVDRATAARFPGAAHRPTAPSALPQPHFPASQAVPPPPAAPPPVAPPQAGPASIAPQWAFPQWTSLPQVAPSSVAPQEAVPSPITPPRFAPPMSPPPRTAPTNVTPPVGTDRPHSPPAPPAPPPPPSAAPQISPLSYPAPSAPSAAWPSTAAQPSAGWPRAARPDQRGWDLSRPETQRSGADGPAATGWVPDTSQLTARPHSADRTSPADRTPPTHGNLPAERARRPNGPPPRGTNTPPASSAPAPAKGQDSPAAPTPEEGHGVPPRRGRLRAGTRHANRPEST
ncbi:hypothetical protein [Frankia sp. AiPa1]|uniref:hypothetical protein n=1 Tax=Frankia sp. AiPa1 TaxID=573492 RepID=UPI00202B0F00|nr:hypothetical protein [Frankia sp. AiPa1]MCL9761480.1 hypothetical protein [Frankia sp. AiPa1]